jgi:DNA (cytosine-5)-methyltransferase 1
MGLHTAGFEVVGVDIAAQKNYPFEFVKADAMTYPLEGFDYIWASPPCQAYSRAQRIRGNEHPDHIGELRKRLRASGITWTMENVIGAPLECPVELCGAMFGLRVYRHRLFESSFYVRPPHHPEHVAPLRKMGRRVQPGEFMHVVGNFTGVELAREAMGISWMVRDELREAIPPAYSEFIARKAIPYILAGLKERIVALENEVQSMAEDLAGASL